VSAKPRGYYVLDARLFGRPMILRPHDGNLKAPEGGILFLSVSTNAKGDTFEAGFEFETSDAAEEAITRTLEHGQAHGRTWAPEHFVVAPAASYVEAARAIRKARRKADADEVEATP
jgi:hypothetical protein